MSEAIDYPKQQLADRFDQIFEQNADCTCLGVSVMTRKVFTAVVLQIAEQTAVSAAKVAEQEIALELQKQRAE